MEGFGNRKVLRQEQARETTRYLPMRSLLQSGMMENKPYVTGPLLAYVINFSTKDPHPHKFLYPVCTKRLENGRVCGKSLQFGQQCDHDSFAKGDVIYKYRFGVLLSDAEHDGSALPLWCQISQAASLLLGVEAKVFSQWTEKDQYQYVRDVILRVPRCEVYLRVERREARVHIMERTFPTLNRPLSPYLPVQTSSNDKGKGKIDEIVEQQDELRDGVASSLDVGNLGENQGIAEEQDELRRGETSSKDNGTGQMLEMVQVQGELRSRDHVCEIEEVMDDGPLDSELRPNSSSIMDFPNQTSQASLSILYNEVEPFVPQYIASQFSWPTSQFSWPSSDLEDGAKPRAKPRVKPIELLKKGRNKLLAVLRGRV